MSADTIARLKITLDGVEPAVLRRVEASRCRSTSGSIGCT
jgi:hypothetical protein